MNNPKQFWNEMAQREDWRNHILPRKSDLDFDFEGWVEAQRLMYFFDSNSIVIDYGCGIGRVLRYISQRAKHAIGLDICDLFIGRAREYAGDEVGLALSDEFEEENIADFVYSLMVLQHNNLENQKKIMEHIFKILKPGGTALVSFPRHESTYYTENPGLHKFKKTEVDAFGEMFQSYRIIEGQLPNYENPIDNMNHEYFLIAIK